jgi:hypothetical protein
MPDILLTPPLQRLQTQFGMPVLDETAAAAPGVVLLRETGDLSLPALVLLHQGQVLGNIARMRDWGDYATRLATMLAPLTSQPESAS